MLSAQVPPQTRPYPISMRPAVHHLSASAEEAVQHTSSIACISTQQPSPLPGCRTTRSTLRSALLQQVRRGMHDRGINWCRQYLPAVR
jgi:hypothetical protein